MDFLAAHARNNPDRLAIILSGTSVSYQQLDEKSNQLANALLSLGSSPHDRMTTVGYNSVEHSVIGAAARKCQQVALPMNSRLTAEEVHYQLAHSESRAVFCGPQHLQRVLAVEDRCPDLLVKIAWGEVDLPPDWHHLDQLIDSASNEPPPVAAGISGPAMTYTAGTTGNPKGAYRKDGIDPSVIQNYMRWFDLRPGDFHLVAGPLYHSAPGAFASFNLIFGGTNVVLERFDAEAALQAIQEHKISTTFMAPILLQRLINLPRQTLDRYDSSSLRSVVVASAPCPLDVKEAFLTEFGPVLYEFYGSSEVGCNTVLRPDEHLTHPNSCGRPVEGIEFKILDSNKQEVPVGETGELFIKSKQVITEYWKNQDATDAARLDGYFSVGDIGYLDEDGFLYIVDRKRDMVISGGVNICTSEIENVLHAHPDIWDLVVIGIPDKEWGESVHAIIEPQPGVLPDETEIAGWLSHRLADYKRPKSYSFQTTLPRDEAGKIRKRELREPYWLGQGKRV